MRSFFTAVLAIVACAAAQAPDRSTFSNLNRADLCGHVNGPITAYARHGRMRTKIGLIQEKCMCMSELPQHMYSDDTAVAAVHVIGEKSTLDALTDLLESARDAQTCQFPPNSVSHCTRDDPCYFVCEDGYAQHPNAHAPTSCRCVSEKCSLVQLEEQSPSKVKREPTPSKRDSPSLKPRAPNPSLKPRSPVPSLKPRSPVPSLKPRSPVPSLKPRSPVPSLKPRSPVPSLKPRSPVPSLKPRSPVPSLKPRSPVPSLKPRSPTPSLKPRSPVPSLKPRSPAPSLHARAPEPAPAPFPEPSSHPKYEKRDKDEEWEYNCGDWTACGVLNGHSGGRKEWECVNTWKDLESCGGCTIPFPFDNLYSSPVGTDCTAIPGVDDVECNMGSCIIHRCKTLEGWHVSADRKSCVQTDSDSSSKAKSPLMDMASEYGLEHVPLQ